MLQIPCFSKRTLALAGLAMALGTQPANMMACTNCDYEHQSGFFYWVGSCFIAETAVICDDGTCMTVFYACPSGSSSSGTSCTC